MEGTIITSLSGKCTTPDTRKHTNKIKHSLFAAKTHGRAFLVYKCSGTAPPGIGGLAVLLNCALFYDKHKRITRKKLTYTEDEVNYPRKA